MARYVKGDNIDLDSTLGQSFFGVAGRSTGEEWERDIEARYTIQSGPVKGMVSFKASFIANRL